jgi:hypothetical protein
MNEHLDSKELACSVLLTLGPQSDSALVASPKLLEAEATEIWGENKVGYLGLPHSVNKHK